MWEEKRAASAIKVTSEKIANMVRTFLKEDSNGLQISTAKMCPEKVTNTVGTFLNFE